MWGEFDVQEGRLCGQLICVFEGLDARSRRPDLLLCLGAKEEQLLSYLARISTGSDNVATAVVIANSDDEAFGLAKIWAASLASNDDVLLLVKLPNGTFETFRREDFDANQT